MLVLGSACSIIIIFKNNSPLPESWVRELDADADADDDDDDDNDDDEFVVVVVMML
jgi:hypothetical protein